MYTVKQALVACPNLRLQRLGSHRCSYSVGAANVASHNVSALVSFINVTQLGAIAHLVDHRRFRFQSLAVHNLERAFAGHDLKYDQLRSAVPGTQNFVFQTGSQEVRDAAAKAIIEAMSKVYALVIAASAFLAVAPGEEGEVPHEGCGGE